MYAIALSALVVFLAELGDKSQLLAMTFATRYRARTVILGMGIACVVINLLSALVGNAVGDALPEDVVRIGAGLLFLVFAALTLRSLGDAEDDETPAIKAHTRAAVVTVGLAFAAAEFGDKTMLTAMGLSTRYEWWQIWIGSSLGMLTSIVIAALLGRQVMRVLPVRAVHLVAALLFAALGVWLLVG